MKSASLLLPAVLGTAGCFGGGPVDLRYHSSRQVRPLVGERLPAVYISRVDGRGGIVLASADRPKLLLKKPVEASIKEALAETLQDLGMKIAAADKADANLSAALALGEITGQERNSRTPMGLVRLTIDLSFEDRKGQSLWEGEVKGVGDIAVEGSVGGAANAALADAMAGVGPLLASDRVVTRILSPGAAQ